MAMSLGNKSRSTNAWMIVVTSTAVTVSVATTHRMRAKLLVAMVGTAFEYLIVATAAAVIGNVYAHHASENLQGKNIVFIITVKYSSEREIVGVLST